MIVNMYTCLLFLSYEYLRLVNADRANYAEDAFIAEHHFSGWAKFGTTALRYREKPSTSTDVMISVVEQFRRIFEPCKQ